MHQADMVTDFKLKEGGNPVLIVQLLRALNAYLHSKDLQAEEYDFRAWTRPRSAKGEQRLPQDYKWLVVFTVEGGSEGYYIHLVAIETIENRFTDLGVAKTYSATSAYDIAREAQRFLTAAAWN